MRTPWILIFILLVFASGGCSSSPTEAGDSSAVPSLNPQVSPSKEPPGTHPPEFPTQGEPTQMAPSMPAPLQNLIDKAKTDLAQRLSISITLIRFIEVDEVTWPDSSLGCPQDGMAYAQVLTPGYLIRLEYSNNQYEYHSGKGAEVIYCANPTAPVPGAPDTY